MDIGELQSLLQSHLRQTKVGRNAVHVENNNSIHSQPAIHTIKTKTLHLTFPPRIDFFFIQLKFKAYFDYHRPVKGADLEVFRLMFDHRV